MMERAPVPRAYLPRGGKITVDLSAASGTFTVEWIHPLAGTLAAGKPIHGGAKRSLPAPFEGDAILHLKIK